MKAQTKLSRELKALTTEVEFYRRKKAS